MTDLEICKKIAEIEGYDISFQDGFVCFEKENDIGFELNPLENKALCWDLMIKHNIALQKTKDYFGAERYEVYINPSSIYDENPQKAVCLAIIKKHEVSNNE